MSKRRDLLRNRVGVTNKLTTLGFERSRAKSEERTVQTSGKSSHSRDQTEVLKTASFRIDKPLSTRAPLERDNTRQPVASYRINALSLPTITSLEGKKPSVGQSVEKSLQPVYHHTFIPQKKHIERFSVMIDILSKIRHRYQDKEVMHQQVAAWKSPHDPSIIEYDEMEKRLTLLGFHPKRSDLLEFSKYLTDQHKTEPRGMPLKEFVAAAFLIDDAELRKQIEAGCGGNIVFREMKRQASEKEETRQQHRVLSTFSRHRDLIYSKLKDAKDLKQDNAFSSLEHLGLGARNIDETTQQLFVQNYLTDSGEFRGSEFYRDMEAFKPNKKYRVVSFERQEAKIETGHRGRP